MNKTSSDCGGMKIRRPENSYILSPSTDTNYKITLKGLTQDLDMQVIDSNTGSDCDSACETSDIESGTMNETVNFTGFGSSTYFVVVNSKSTPGPYALEVDCVLPCNSGAQNSLSCDSPRRLAIEQRPHGLDRRGGQLGL